MPSDAYASSPTVPLRVTFTVNGRPVPVEVAVRSARSRLDQLLPALLEIDDRLIEANTAQHEAAGEKISCAKGCSACCRRQPVPMTPPEAYAIARLVDAMPEPRQSAVRAAFTAAAARLSEAGIHDAYMRRDPNMTAETARETTRVYLSLALACPFLSHDECSIYPERPFVCRQYLVTTPPALCEAPFDNPVRTVGAPASFATAMLTAAEALSGRPQYTVPLVLALEYAQAHRADLEQTYEPKAVIGAVFAALKDA